MIYTTLNHIREHSPCTDGWRKLLKHLGKTEADDDPLAYSTILESNGLDDVLWCLRARWWIGGKERAMTDRYEEILDALVNEATKGGV